MKKTLLALVLILALALSAFVLTACNNVEEGEPIVNQEEMATDIRDIAGEPILDMSYDDLWQKVSEAGFDTESTTYDDVADFLGIDGAIDKEWSSDKWAAYWYATPEGYITVFFSNDTNLYSSMSGSAYGTYSAEDWMETVE